MNSDLYFSKIEKITEKQKDGHRKGDRLLRHCDRFRLELVTDTKTYA